MVFFLRFAGNGSAPLAHPCCFRLACSCCDRNLLRNRPQNAWFKQQLFGLKSERRPVSPDARRLTLGEKPESMKLPVSVDTTKRKWSRTASILHSSPRRAFFFGVPDPFYGGVPPLSSGCPQDRGETKCTTPCSLWFWNSPDHTELVIHGDDRLLGHEVVGLIVS